MIWFIFQLARGCLWCNSRVISLLEPFQQHLIPSLLLLGLYSSHFPIMHRTKKRICIKFALCKYVASMSFAQLCTQCKCGDGRICPFLCKFGHRHLCTGCKGLRIYLQHICTRQIWGKFDFSYHLLGLLNLISGFRSAFILIHLVWNGPKAVGPASTKILAETSDESL